MRELPSAFDDVAGALANLVYQVEMDATRKAVDAELGASEWEAFVPTSVWNALSHANSVLREIKGCAACDGDPEAHGMHVCGKEPFA